MAANLTLQYLKAEEKYRQAETPQTRIQCLEQMLQLIPRHKGTDRLQGMLRSKLKEARTELQAEKNASRPGRSYRIPRQGAGTVVIVGAPNAGKSRLLKELTSANPEIAPYPFTTREPQAGMMAWEGLQIQLLDTPPVTRNFVEPYVVSFIRSADLVLLCINGSDDDAMQSTRDVIEELAQRKTRLSTRTGFDAEDFSIVEVRTLFVVTHGNDPDVETRLELLNLPELSLGGPVRVDFEKTEEISHLRSVIGRTLPILRIFTRKPGESDPDSAPTPLPHGATIEDLAMKIHNELAADLKFAKVWSAGSQVGRTVTRDHVLQDLDVVEMY